MIKYGGKKTNKTTPVESDDLLQNQGTPKPWENKQESFRILLIEPENLKTMGNKQKSLRIKLAGSRYNPALGNIGKTNKNQAFTPQA